MLILLYHDIVKVGLEKKLYSIDENFFKEQIFYLKDKGYRFLTLKELVYLIEENKLLPEKAVVLTFDDGLIGQFELGFKILKELNISAVFFVIVKNIGKPNYLTWQILKILKDSNMEIGSHGLSHLPFDLLSEKEIVEELEVSKKILEDNLNMPIEFFSLPRGFYKRKKIKILAKNIGYRAVCSSKVGYINSRADLFFLKRFFFKKNDNLSRFVKILEKDYFIFFSYKINELLRSSARNILGFRNYNNIRKLILKEEY